MHKIGYLGIFVALVGLAGLWWGVRTSRKSARQIAAAQSWPEATAVVDTIDVQSFHTPGTRTYSFEPKLRYRFQVGGREYSGERLRFGYYRTGTQGKARKLLEAYQPGSWIPVRYDPMNPAENVVELNVSSNQRVAIIMGGIVMAMGLAITIAAATGVIDPNEGRGGRSSYRR